jgi:hypothetical protein
MKTARGVPDAGEAMGERDGIVSPSLVKESGLGVVIGVGLAVGLVGVGVAVRLGVLSGEILGVKATVVASAGAVGAAVGGSAGEQPVKRMMDKYRASPIMAPNCR